ncbi:CDP-alcohol phosphatidyltransferase family protein [Demequina mangrovi]|uniref:CDP-diacylglycerol--glycerol-3-phosphate 3-phosphatidyltransferase n=1 Tax=Demequina mangrovi TaxID=1043493 RepID=A0A1H6ZNX3_9MICO|nr:CDP-alcohol phosphatidyltransferase family protein [Demequina mangrovi]SEJ50515.1 CDP-diacylglycerol--glycerol-3-phosphate 3-phosphatidyltransferase [Demequina mangrovi]
MRPTPQDVLSLARVPIGLCLAMAPPRGARSLALIAAGTVSDLLDGPCARARGEASDQGARLDSIADGVLVAGAAVAFARGVTMPRAGWAAVGTVVALRGVTLAVTRARFGMWSIAHTRLNKLSGGVLAVGATAALARGRAGVPLALAVAAPAVIASAEELVMVLAAERYDRDAAGLIREV